MRIRDGKRTDEILKREVRDDEKENRDYYIKSDPDFDKWTYSVCHKSLRKVLLPNDLLFFRTLWRGQQYFVGYFEISLKTGDEINPICHADFGKSLLIDGYRFVIKPEIVVILNENANFSETSNKKRFISHHLARNYLRIDEEKTAFLKSEIDKYRQGKKS